MSTSHSHTGGTPGGGAPGGRGPWYAQAEAKDFPYTLRELRNLLDRLGYRAQAGKVGGEEVREMQARVAAFRDSLQHRARRDPPGPDAADDDAHAARTRYYERRIQAALADMAVQLGDKRWSDHAPPGLDVASRAWLDQRFAALRGQLADALSPQARPAAAHAALEDARQRLNAMERKLTEAAERQHEANHTIISLVGARACQVQSAPLASIDRRLDALQQGFDRAMGELDSMRKGTERLAIRASATVARQTARATAHHVAKAVREAAPEHRFARLEEGLSDCIDETRTLRHEAAVMRQTLENGLEDLRGRINELTLITRKALTPQARPPEGINAGVPAENHAPAAQPPARRHAWPPQMAHTAQDAPARSGSGLISRLGLVVVVVLLILASFAMLYAQLSGHGWRLPAITDRQETPASTSKANRLEPVPAHDGDNGRVILPGIILTVVPLQRV